jgi:hypothetical protein
MASTSPPDNKITVRERPGWLVPLAAFATTALLSGLLLLYYLGPRPMALVREHPAPTASRDPISLSVGGVNFSIPANYFRYRAARHGGVQTEVALAAALPDFRGFSEPDAAVFSGNAVDSPVIYILLHEEKLKLAEIDRFRRIYLAYVTDPNGRKGPFGLTQYEFQDDSGYRGENLFVGRLGTRPVVLRCVRMSANVPSPSCLREVRLARHAALSYRFKRAQLARWREIASGVDSLMHSFMRGS